MAALAGGFRSSHCVVDRGNSDRIDMGETQRYTTLSFGFAGCRHGACVIRIVVTFLVALQAIVPPGACLCQFVPFESTTRPVKGAAPALHITHTASAAEPCCSCVACRTAPNASTPTPLGNGTATSRETAAEHSCPSPHAPCSGCPAVSAGAGERVAIPAEILSDVPVLFFVPADAPAPPRADRYERPAVSPPTPLFVRHCAFLI